MKSFELDVIERMIRCNVIPSSGMFQISENHLTNYVNTYKLLFGKGTKGLGGSSNRRYARKLAGLTLLKVNFERGAKFNQLNSGIVYMIENPAFPNHYKIGMTIDLDTRLSQYQTYDPFKKFSVSKYEFVINRKDIERQILNHPDVLNESGEWIKKENAKEIFAKIV